MELSIAMPYGNAPARDEPSKLMYDAAWKTPEETVSVDGHFVGVRKYEDGYLYTKMDAKDEAMVYICFVNKFDYHGRPVFVQKNVWQLGHCPPGFARKVMRYFSDGERILVSDTRQRKRGADMWKRFIGLTSDRYLYLQTPKGISQIEPHTKEHLLFSGYNGDAANKVFIATGQPIIGAVRHNW